MSWLKILWGSGDAPPSPPPSVSPEELQATRQEFDRRARALEDALWASRGFPDEHEGYRPSFRSQEPPSVEQN